MRCNLCGFSTGDTPLHRFFKFWSDQGGNTAVLFGLAIVPVIALSGGAVDFSQRADTRTKLQSAADSAALAAARAVQAGKESGGVKWGKLKKEAETIAANVFAATTAHIPGAPGRRPMIKVKRDSVTVNANSDVPTSFLGVLGISKLRAEVHAEVGIPDPVSVEIVLVLDYSKSMEQNDKYIRMTTAARTFVDRIAVERGQRTKIGIVPFSEYVYGEVRGAHVRGTQPAQSNKPVTACLANRDYPYSATADEPKKSVDASRWRAADPASAQCAAYPANSLMLHDLTSDFTALTGALSNMRPVGWTNIALAAEMGWHMLSPGEPFEALNYPKAGKSVGKDDDEEDDNVIVTSSRAGDGVRKIMILLTDGVQTVSAMGPNGAVSTLAADEVTAELCANMKLEGIQTFSVAYDIEEMRVRDLLKGCASGSSAYHEAAGADDISKVFDTIFDQIVESVWLSR